jgi:hypothetical protein
MSLFNPPAKTVALDTGTYTKYCIFQVQWPGRINHLKPADQQFEIPDKDDADKCMPPMLAKYDAKVEADDPQPYQNYENGKSCEFDPARIAAYEQVSRTLVGSPGWGERRVAVGKGGVYAPPPPNPPPPPFKAMELLRQNFVEDHEFVQVITT